MKRVVAKRIIKSESVITKVPNQEVIKEAILESYREIEEGKTKLKYVPEFYNAFSSLILYSLACFCLLVAGATIWVIYTTINGFVNLHTYMLLETIVRTITGIIIGFFTLVIGAVSYKSAKEIEKVKDANLISTMFSNTVAFAAIIIALLSLNIK